jgi:SAM-dependent methyltransferase
MHNSSILDSLKAFVKKHPALYIFALNFLSPVLATGKSHKTILDLVPTDEIVLNLGSGPTRLSDRILNVDFHPYKNVDLIADVHHLPLKSNSVGGVISIAMLEHVEDPRSVVDEMHRILKPGGHIYSIVPFIFGYHSAPNDYYRWTKEGFRNLFSSFGEIEIGVYSGPTSSMLIILQEWLAMLLSFRSRFLYQILYIFFMISLTPFKIIDFYLHKHPEAHKTAATLYLIAKK